MCAQTVATVTLRKDREKSLRRRHPWIFSGAVDAVDGDPEPGAIVRVASHTGEFLAWGYFNTRSKIEVRVLDWNASSEIDEGWWHARVREAIDRRRGLPAFDGAGMCRLIHAEADGLPGFVADRYGPWIVVQALTAGVERAKAVLCGALGAILSPEGIFERSDTDARQMEGLPPVVGPVAGAAPPVPVEVSDGYHTFAVDVAAGHKTGFYIDQTENRATVARWARGRNVLDLFAYTGGFAVHALAAGAASATLVDSAAGALALARRNIELNGLDAGRVEFLPSNVFEQVRAYRDAGRRFGLIVVDPPRLAVTRAQVGKAGRAYKDINLLALKLLEPGGVLATFSCSGAVGGTQLARIVGWASVDAGRPVQVIERLGQGADHPFDPLVPESEYLSGLVCRVG